MVIKKDTTTDFSVDPSSTINSPSGNISTPVWTNLWNSEPTNNGSGAPIDNTQTQIKNTQNIQENAQVDVIKAKQDALNTNENFWDDITNSFNKSQEEIKTITDDNKTRTEQFYNEQNANIKAEQEEILAIQTAQINQYWDRVDRDAQVLAEKQKSEVAQLQAEANFQKIQNEDSIRQANIDVDIQRQQSAWAYSKMGLWFSSWIINQSQSIATNWIVKIASIKAKMSLDEATIATKVADVEFKYTDLVNTTIDNYIDKTDALRLKMTEQINEANRNIRTNSFDKQTEISKIEDDMRKEVKEAERQHIEDITAVKDKGIELSESIQDDVNAYAVKELNKLDMMVENGTITTLSPTQIAQKEAELWLPTWTINAQLDSWIDKDLRAYYDEVLGKWMLTGNFSVLRDEVKQEMKLWATFQDAVETVANRDIDSSADLTAIRNEKGQASTLAERKFALDEKKFELDRAYKGWTLDVNQYKADTDRLNAETKRLEATGETTTINDYSALDVWGTYNGFKITQTFWTKGWPNAIDNWANGWTPWVDIAMPEGTWVQSFVTGTIVSAWLNGDYGNQIVVKDAQWNEHMYSHLSGMDVVVWATVNPWDFIWASWNTGFSTGAHLDYRVKATSWEWVDPRWYMNGIEISASNDRTILESKAIELWLDRKDVPQVTNQDLVSYIDNNKIVKNRAEVSKTTQPFLDEVASAFTMWAIKKTAKKAYEELLKDGFTPDEALDQIAQLDDELTVKWWALYEVDTFSDDFVFKPNK